MVLMKAVAAGLIAAIVVGGAALALSVLYLTQAVETIEREPGVSQRDWFLTLDPGFFVLMGGAFSAGFGIALWWLIRARDVGL